MATFDPYADLKQRLGEGEVCAFVGAGLSVGAGLPGWYDLVARPRAPAGEVKARLAFLRNRGVVRKFGGEDRYV